MFPETNLRRGWSDISILDARGIQLIMYSPDQALDVVESIYTYVSATQASCSSCSDEGGRLGVFESVPTYAADCTWSVGTRVRTYDWRVKCAYTSAMSVRSCAAGRSIVTERILTELGRYMIIHRPNPQSRVHAKRASRSPGPARGSWTPCGHEGLRGTALSGS